MDIPESNLSDLVLRIDAAITEGRQVELLRELDIPVGQEPEPVHLALWLPDMVVCGKCTDLLVTPGHPSCAGCGVSNEAKSEVNSEAEGSNSPRLVIVVAGPVAVRVFACAECMPRG